MFDLFRRKKKAVAKPGPKPAAAGGAPYVLSLRQVLYSNASLEPFLLYTKPEAFKNFPWSNFDEARQAIKAGDRLEAIGALKEITQAAGLESRILLQAWHTLRSLGEQPPEALAGKILGAVVEYQMPGSLDIVAGYADHTARYWNTAGAGVVWERPDDSLDPFIDRLLAAGQQALDRTGLGEHDCPALPEMGMIRLFLMARGGSCFGYGKYEQLSRDAIGGPLIQEAYRLGEALMKKSSQRA